MKSKEECEESFHAVPLRIVRDTWNRNWNWLCEAHDDSRAWPFALDFLFGRFLAVALVLVSPCHRCRSTMSQYVLIFHWDFEGGLLIFVYICSICSVLFLFLPGAQSGEVSGSG